MTFSETLTLESKTHPGVTVTLRRLGLGRRIDLDTRTLPYRQRRRKLELDFPAATTKEEDLERQIEIAQQKLAAVPANEAAGVIEKDLLPLQAELAACSTPETKDKRSALNLEYALIEGMIRVEMIRASVLSIAHCLPDSQPGELDGMTVDQLLDFGPPDLSAEIYATISPDARLQGGASPNSKSPSISGAVEKASPENTTAPTVEAVLVASI
jgi:hypothetical protein